MLRDRCPSTAKAATTSTHEDASNKANTIEANNDRTECPSARFEELKHKLGLLWRKAQLLRYKSKPLHLQLRGLAEQTRQTIKGSPNFVLAARRQQVQRQFDALQKFVPTGTPVSTHTDLLVSAFDPYLKHTMKWATIVCITLDMHSSAAFVNL